MHGLRFAKAHLGFRRVHIDIHRPWIKRQLQYKTGRGSAVHLVAQSVAYRVQHYLVAHPATVDKQMLRVAIGHRTVWLQYKAIDGEQPRVGVDRGGGVHPLGTQHCGYSCRPRLYRPALHGAPVVRELQRDVASRQAEPTHRIQTVRIFRRFRFQKSPPRRGVEKQFGDRHCCAEPRAHRLRRLVLPALGFQSKRARRALRSAGD